ncbi:MAG TPA: pitrilysin family protein [Burkholderiaceae bacterium]|nr:pitrilysin family protein [Burkholderiaceae bacterium]
MKKLILILTASLAVGFSLNAQAALQIQTWTLANGARVLFVENHSIPIVDLNVDFDAGARRDPAGKAGLAQLTNAMLARGLREGRFSDSGKERGAQAEMTLEPALSEAQISDAFADTAAERGGGADAERANASLRSLSSLPERATAVKLLGRILAQPTFPSELLERDKARTIAGIKEDLTKPEAIAGKAFWHLLYGSHPYGSEATVESVTAITRDDLAVFHRTHYVANRAVISIIGDVTRADAEQIAQELTLRLPQGGPLPPMPPVPDAHAQQQRIAHPASQAHILIGMPAEVRGDPDYFALMVGNYVLGGGGFVSRLTNEVREKRGLTYGVYSGFSPMAQKGPFQIGLQTKKENAEQALRLVNQVVAAFLRDGPTADQLQAAKANLIGSFPLRIDNNRKILANIALIGFYNLPLDYLDTWIEHVAKVSIADVRAAFARKVVQKELSTVVVGAEPEGTGK